MQASLHPGHTLYPSTTLFRSDATFNELEGATINTVTPDGSLDITGANTGEDITIGDMEGTFTGEHAVNHSSTIHSPQSTVNHLQHATIHTVTHHRTTDTTAAN